MRVLLWATTLQADILALALHLDSRPDCALLVVTEHASNFQRTPVHRLRPLTARVLDRSAPDIEATVAQFKADVVVCDNHFPPFDAAPRVCAMWHGLGWKARPTNELAPFYRHVKRLTGSDPRSPNARFLAQCYHARDYGWRTEQWGLAPASCRVTGSCFSDLLRGEAVHSRPELEAEYGLDLSRKTVLLNITWHFGRIFPGSWRPKLTARASFNEDMDFLRELIRHVLRREGNVLLCLHDRKRYEPKYLSAIHEISREFERGLCVRHKDMHPDNWADLWLADVMVSNLSSLSTFFYHYGRPVVHLCPPADQDEIAFAQYSWFGLHRRFRKSSSPPWMNDPRDNGGLSAATPEEALAALDLAMTSPDCCKEKAASWLAEHVAFPAPSASACLADALSELARSA